MPSVACMARELEMNAMVDRLGTKKPEEMEKACRLSGVSSATSWEQDLPVSPVTPPPDNGSPVSSRSATPPHVGERSRPATPAGAHQVRKDDSVLAARTTSAPLKVAGVPRPRAAGRQRSMAAYSSGASRDAESRRISSFTKEVSKHMSRFSRRDSEDSLMSAASEPVSYSNHLYVSSDIWLAEKKLDVVEGGIIEREDKKARRRRGRPGASSSDAFSPEAEGQNFSSRLIGMLWSSPAAHNPMGPRHGAPRHGDPHGLAGRGIGRGNYRVRERGNIDTGVHGTVHNDAHGPRPATSMPKVDSYAAMAERDQIMRSGRILPKKNGMYFMRKALKRADIARWIRHRHNLRVERREF